MLYQFRSIDGEVIEVQAPMSSAPELGSKIHRDGKEFVRILSAAPVARLDYDHDQYPKISKTLPQFSKGADFVNTPGRNYGCPIINSRLHQDQMCSRHGFTREFSDSDY